MAKNPPKRTPQRPKLRWRRTRIIREWREDDARDYTQQEVADHLAGLKPPIILDRVSIARIEAGTQMPAIEVLEAMARLYRTDVDSMLNLSPADAVDIIEFKSWEPTERRRAVRAFRAAKGEDAG